MDVRPAAAGGTPVRDSKIFYAHQSIDQSDIDAVAEVMRSDYLTCGPAIDAAEQKLCEVTGAKYAVLCSSGTAALHIACLAAGVGAGDEVITTPITFAASANCALYCGARPVFADIDPETWQLSPARAEEKITEKTKAIIPVDFGGQAVDEEAFLRIARKHGLVYIEDACHSIGTTYTWQGRFDDEAGEKAFRRESDPVKGETRRIGQFADMTVMSFHPVKTICGGEGGAVLTDNEEYYKKLLVMRTHGITRDPSLMSKEPDGPWYYEQVALSTNYRITDMQAALIGSQLKKLPQFAARRKEIRRRYDEAFSRIPQLVVQKETEGSDSVRHLYILRLNPEKISIDRAEFFAAMGAENIVCNVHYIPIYTFPYYQEIGYGQGLCPEAEKLYSEMLTIPFYHGMSDEDVESVITAVQRICAWYAR